MNSDKDSNLNSTLLLFFQILKYWAHEYLCVIEITYVLYLELDMI